MTESAAVLPATVNEALLEALELARRTGAMSFMGLRYEVGARVRLDVFQGTEESPRWVAHIECRDFRTALAVREVLTGSFASRTIIIPDGFRVQGVCIWMGDIVPPDPFSVSDHGSKLPSPMNRVYAGEQTGIGRMKMEAKLRILAENRHGRQLARGDATNPALYYIEVSLPETGILRLFEFEEAARMQYFEELLATNWLISWGARYQPSFASSMRTGTGETVYQPSR